ncbi:DUF4435 domain-containing protein [Pseudomonas sp. NFACC46-3]|uniref:DUF4435 domain-containing protein n=1 Tax=Pseudomonas sp. NFACC46-3 TaxID=1566200 RepID=UPI0008E942F5|nr:DUF4435 domain-containing protein [Pseudomonas sp. NFACC46-3]SFL41115.1 Protein of unknown function [Pseudomonas sp. NFACC46-3]
MKHNSLKKYQSNPNHLLSTAFQMYRSTGIQTAVVEGQTDKRFLSQWCKPDAKIRFAGFEGKPHVEDVYRASKRTPYSGSEFLYFFADIDYDQVNNRALVIDARFIYNAYCHQSKTVEFNDLETFLINSSAFEKVLANHDLETSMAQGLRVKLEAASRQIGALRAADLSLPSKLGLSRSILNGIEIETFFSAKDLTVDMKALHEHLPLWTNYKLHVDDLIDEAELINKATPGLWALSRGHDITEMLTLHLQTLGHPHLRADRLELMLRLACEYAVFKESAMGRKLMTERHEYFLRD